MGAIDEIRCRVPLPIDRDGKDVWWQTKSLDKFGRYEIREDGLWVERNKTWEQLPDFTGDIRFYGNLDGWCEFTARFVAGRLVELVEEEDRREKKEGE